MRRHLAIAAALALIVLAGCDGSDSGDSTPPNPLLLKAKDLNGTAKAAAIRGSDSASPTLCGPDSAIIRQGSSQRDFAAFTRDNERVVVGAWQYPGNDVELWLKDIRDKTKDSTCRNGTANKPPTVRWTVNGILTSEPNTAAFTWTRWQVADSKRTATAPPTPTDGDGFTATSGARAYRRLGHYVVMATISNSTVTPPTADQLEAVLDREAKLVDTTPGLAGPDACGLLEDKQVRAALGTKPKTVLDESTDREDSATNTLICRYLGRDDARLTFRGHRERAADVARTKLAVARGACSSAVVLDTSTMAISRATGFVCPGTDSTVTAWLEWQSILLQIDLAPSDMTSPSEAADRIRSVATDLNRAMTFDAFGP